MKLLKIENEYKLYGEDDSCIATTYESPYKRLSKENCNEIFGVVDVINGTYKQVRNGFDGIIDSFTEAFAKQCISKAMELNKDKLFTVEDMYEAIRKAKSYDKIPNHEGIIVSFNYSKDEIIESLQQPKEIEVEIEMEYVGECNGNNDNGCFQNSSGHNCGCFSKQPRIDHRGCLILKKRHEK